MARARRHPGMRTPTGATLLLLLVASGCGGNTTPATHAPVAVAHTATPTHATSPRLAKPSTRRHVEPPCDPGGGTPQPRAGCPDPTPETGWLRVRATGDPTLRLFRTVLDDEEGRAYARAHGASSRFFDGFADVPTGERRRVGLDAGTICTGVTIDPVPNVADHVVPCVDLVATAGEYALPVVAWTADGRVVQLSQLYRP